MPHKFMLIKRVANGWIIQTAEDVCDPGKEELVAEHNNTALDIVSKFLDSHIATHDKQQSK